MKIQMPDAFLKRWIQMSNEKPLSDEQLEKEYPNYARIHALAVIATSRNERYRYARIH